MNTDEITKKLDELATMREDFDKLRAAQERLKDEAIPAEVRQRLDEIEAEFGPALQAAANGIAVLEGKIKTAVVETGASVKGRLFAGRLCQRAGQVGHEGARWCCGRSPGVDAIPVGGRA